MIYGYARVLTEGQSYEAQFMQFEVAGCAKVFAETVSGAWSDRAKLAKLMKVLALGGVLMVTRLVRQQSRDCVEGAVQPSPAVSLPPGAVYATTGAGCDGAAAWGDAEGVEGVTA
ncbi:MAG: recombinase family protein [Rhodobacteraceae bacterium]|jgi:hypothetical protein|nr:recombinase family protein [Paracoccaceae bacterium]